MDHVFTAVFQKVPEGYIGFVEELPGANTQGRTLDEARVTLEDAVRMVLEANRLLACDASLSTSSVNRSWWRGGMSSSEPKAGERVLDVRCDDDSIIVSLADGRTISVPLAWFPRLLNATPSQRAQWQLSGAGFGIHWPDLDEDLSAEGLLRGAPAPRRTGRPVVRAS